MLENGVISGTTSESIIWKSRYLFFSTSDGCINLIPYRIDTLPTLQFYTHIHTSKQVSTTRTERDAKRVIS